MTISCMAAAGRRWRTAPMCSRSCATSMSGSPASSRRRKPAAGSWCRPSPAAPARRRMSPRMPIERIVKVMVDGIAAAGPLDAVYLDLHGAMVTEHLDDGEGEILRARARGDRQGPAAGRQPRPARQCHAGDGRACRRADRLPHLSACRHGRHRPRRRANIWRCCSTTKQRFAKAFRQLPFLIPISWQCTNDQPTKGIYQKLAALESDAVPTLSFAPGFPAADFAALRAERVRLWRDAGRCRCRGRHDRRADRTATRTISTAASITPDEGVRHAMELAKTATQADRHRRHPGQSRRRRRFRHHRHAARAGPQQRRAAPRSA